MKTFDFEFQSKGITFYLKVIWTGQNLGTSDHLTNITAIPLVEFWTINQHAQPQFISRYHLTEIYLADFHGLTLEPGFPMIYEDAHDLLHTQLRGLYNQWKEMHPGYYRPYWDETGSIVLMSYRNNRLSYGITSTGKFALCQSPVMQDVILRIIAESYSQEAIRKRFFEVKEEYLA